MPSCRSIYVRNAGPNGALAVFVRSTSEKPIDAGVPDNPATELLVVNVDNKKAWRVLGSKDAENMQELLADFQAPQFSPDSKTIYFLSAAWVTSRAIHKVDLDTRRERFIAPGNTLEVIRDGEYAGHLKVWQHRYNDNGAYDCEYLLTPDGNTVRAIDASCDE